MRPLIALLLFPALAHAEPDVSRGRSLFVADGCSQCHGTLGQGSAAGARLAPDPKPLIVIQTYVRNPGGQMPPYHPTVLSNADLADIHAYLSTIRRPAAPLLDHIP